MKLSNISILALTVAQASGCAEKDYLVTLDDSRNSARMLTTATGVTTVRTFAKGTVSHVKACSSVATKLAKTAGILSVEEDYPGAVHKPENERTQQEHARQLRGLQDDEHVVTTSGNTPWGLDRVNQAGLPLDGTYDYDYDGEGVCVYVLDTGARVSHNEFKGRVTKGLNIAYPGRGFDNDKDGHGTHCASTAVGKEYGVAPGATLIPVKVLDDQGSGTWADVIEGVDWAVNDNEQCKDKRKVISMSIVGPKHNAMNAVCQKSTDAVIVVAAGNDSGKDSCKGSPSSATGDHVLTVGSTDMGDVVSSFSSEGKCLDVLAPGTDIKAAGRKSDKATDTMSGTSMATPHVSGIAAQIWQQNPDFSASEIANRLLQIAIPHVGAGRVRDDTPQLLANTPRSGETTMRQRSIDALTGGDLEMGGKTRKYAMAVDFGASSFSNVIPVDGAVINTDVSPSDGCGSIKMNLDGQVALIDRGDCDFVVKARNAQRAGAVAMIVVNNEKKGFVDMYKPVKDKAKDITIPSAMISKNDGKAIRKLNAPRLGAKMPNPCDLHKKQTECDNDTLEAFFDASCLWENDACATTNNGRTHAPVAPTTSAPSPPPTTAAPSTAQPTNAPVSASEICPTIVSRKTCDLNDACEWSGPSPKKGGKCWPKGEAPTAAPTDPLTLREECARLNKKQCRKTSFSCAWDFGAAKGHRCVPVSSAPTQAPSTGPAMTSAPTTQAPVVSTDAPTEPILDEHEENGETRRRVRL